jgi:ABC-type multidrug transport system fused ATPase/permease subunit
MFWQHTLLRNFQIKNILKKLILHYNNFSLKKPYRLPFILILTTINYKNHTHNIKMNLVTKENQLTYFKFFYSILGFKMVFAIFLNVIIGLLDGLGITMLFPLLQSMDGSTSDTESMGQFRHIITFFQNTGLPLTANVILMIFLGLFILKGIVKFFSTMYQINIQLFFFKRMQFDFIKNFRKMSYNGFLQLDAGVIQNTMTGEVWRVAEAMRSYTKWSNSLFMLLTYVFLAFLANPEFAFLISLGVVTINLFYRKLYIKVKTASYEISKKGGKFSGYLIELVHHFKYLKSTNYISFYTKKIKQVIQQRINLDLKLGKLSAIIVSIKEPTVVFIVVLVMLIQINYIGGGIGSIILSLLLFYRGLNHLLSLQSEWQAFLRQSGGFRMVAEVTKKMTDEKEISGTIEFESLQKELRLENVNFSFGKNKVLKDINLSIPKNTTIAFTGVSGSGKTTLINIISGLLKPNEGDIIVDGIKLSEYDIESYRSKIGYISQEPVVFNDTIYNNITFWAEPTAENQKRFWEVIEMASLFDFINEQEEKENAPLGDNGLLVSGGQKQRISIARELFKNAEILILDEATSALDSETENIIRENIERLHGHYTMFIIAHRFSTIKHVDEIYLIEDGEIVHSGNFSEMIEHSAKFKLLVSLQGL